LQKEVINISFNHSQEHYDAHKNFRLSQVACRVILVKDRIRQQPLIGMDHSHQHCF